MYARIADPWSANKGRLTEPRRIKPPKQHDGLVETLVADGVFETKRAAMMFAAAVGYRYASRKPLDSGGEGIRWNVIGKNRDDGPHALPLSRNGRGGANRPHPLPLSRRRGEQTTLALAVKKDLAVHDPDAVGELRTGGPMAAPQVGELPLAQSKLPSPPAPLPQARGAKATPGNILENFLGLVQQYRASQVERPLGLEGLDRSAPGTAGRFGRIAPAWRLPARLGCTPEPTFSQHRPGHRKRGPSARQINQVSGLAGVEPDVSCSAKQVDPRFRPVFFVIRADFRASPGDSANRRRWPSRRTQIAPQVARACGELRRQSDLPTWHYSSINSSGVQIIGIR